MTTSTNPKSKVNFSLNLLIFMNFHTKPTLKSSKIHQNPLLYI
nr:MAG TPA: hypothetical protein [Caudoviricetes sp.]